MMSPTSATDLFDVYRAATAKAQASGSVTDGIEAGLAWARFVQVFEAKLPSAAIDPTLTQYGILSPQEQVIIRRDEEGHLEIRHPSAVEISEDGGEREIPARAVVIGASNVDHFLAEVVRVMSKGAVQTPRSNIVERA